MTHVHVLINQEHFYLYLLGNIYNYMQMLKLLHFQFCVKQKGSNVDFQKAYESDWCWTPKKAQQGSLQCQKCLALDLSLSVDYLGAFDIIALSVCVQGWKWALCFHKSSTTDISFYTILTMLPRQKAVQTLTYYEVLWTWAAKDVFTSLDSTNRTINSKMVNTSIWNGMS